MLWLWITLAVLGVLCAGLFLGLYLLLLRKYVPVTLRIFQEKPFFIVPFGQPVEDAEQVVLNTPDGLTLEGCYLRALKPRRGVILFGLEFGSNRWACVPYCEFLREAGYDIFSFEMRGQGNSKAQEGYKPLQWVTDFELIDFQTALAYLKNRPDKDPRGIGLFGLSKGASAALTVAARDDFVRCFVVDGIFACLTTMVPHMRHFVMIYALVPAIVKYIPNWFIRLIGKSAIRHLERQRHCHYPSLERCMAQLAPRPLLMIHGGADKYIKPDMARSLFELAGMPKEFWLVDKAKHNQAFQLAPEEYKKRVLAFFEQHLGRVESQEPRDESQTSRRLSSLGS